MGHHHPQDVEGWTAFLSLRLQIVLWDSSANYVHLGLRDWRWAYPSWSCIREEIVQLERDSITRASALLEHIAHDVVFASYVRKMAVYVFINDAEDKVLGARREPISILQNVTFVGF